MLYAFSHTALSLLLLAVAAAPPDACREPQARPAECAASDRLSPEVVLDKVAREHGFNKAEFTIRYAAPYYIIEPKLAPHELGGGTSFKVNALTGEIIEAFFTE